MVIQEVVVTIEASLPEGEDYEKRGWQVDQAIEEALRDIAAGCNWSKVQGNGVRVKVSTG